MTKSLASTYGAGASSLTSQLRKLLRDLDQPSERAYPADEITMLLPWPEGAIELFVKLGVLQEHPSPGPVFVDDCAEPDWAEPEWLFDASMNRVRGYCPCRCSGCCGMHVVERERSRQWRASLDGVVKAVAGALGIRDGWIEDVPQRLFHLGNLTWKGQSREIFLGRGLHWPDTAAMLSQASQLAKAARVTLLCLSNLPATDIRRPSWRTVISLEQLITIDAEELRIARSRLFEHGNSSDSPAISHGALTDQDTDVLEALAEQPMVAMGIADLMAAAGYSKGTLRAVLKRLLGAGLVAHPPGTTRKGVAITSAGVSALEETQRREK